jgi:3-hydroxyacyl-[acyl-carrier-protein] dehydratase
MPPFRIPREHPSLPGHFPGHPVVPGVVLLDRVFAVIEAAHPHAGGWRVPQVKFVQPLLPGQAARVELDGTAPRWRFRVLREDDTLLASGEIAAADAADGGAAAA